MSSIRNFCWFSPTVAAAWANHALAAAPGASHPYSNLQPCGSFPYTSPQGLAVWDAHHAGPTAPGTSCPPMACQGPQTSP